MDANEYECFKEGAKVEVCLEDAGFKGSWYEATILKTPPKTKKSIKVYLEFDNLIDEGDGSPKLLREHVNFLLVRPLIPREPLRTFHLNDDVDAFHNDGWWEGVVTQVHHPPPPPATSDVVQPAARYSVYFRSSRELILFGAADLRLHREWVYGKWVPPLEFPITADEPPSSLEASSAPSEMK